MAWLSVWDFLFSQIQVFITWMKGTSAVTWQDANGTHSISWFVLFISFLLLQLFINVVFFFVDHHGALGDMSSDSDDD